MTSTVTIVLIDDHPVFRSGLVQLLQLEERFRVVAEGGSIDDALTLTERLRPQVLLLDLSMDGDGLDVIGPIIKGSPGTQIVVLTASDAAFDITTAIERGVCGYVLKGSSGAEIIDAVDMAASGRKYVSPRAMSRAILSARTERSNKELLSALSIRELTVLEMVGTGLSNKEIGAKLGIGEKAVKFHITNIFAKLGVRNRVEAALIFKGGL